jgi:hypothetical protein
MSRHAPRGHALGLRGAAGDLAVGDSGEAGEVSGGHPGSVAGIDTRKHLETRHFAEKRRDPLRKC